MLPIWRRGRLGATASSIRYPSFFERKKQQQNYIIKIVKAVLELFKLAVQSRNM